MDAVTHPHPAVRVALASWLEQRVDVSVEAEVARTLGVHAVPTLVVLEGDGRILGRRAGFVAPEALVAWLEAARAGAPR